MERSKLATLLISLLIVVMILFYALPKAEFVPKIFLLFLAIFLTISHFIRKQHRVALIYLGAVVGVLWSFPDLQIFKNVELVVILLWTIGVFVMGKRRDA